MGSDDRFYLLRFHDREVLRGDIGSLLRIHGLVIAGSGCDSVALLLPDASAPVKSLELGVEEWSDFIRRSDDPEILIAGPPKIFQRKLRFEISSMVQQKVWAADGFRCMYCRRPMGHVRLTIDHFYPLENGGINDDKNYISACASCNKKKGNMEPQAWCNSQGLNFTDLSKYLDLRRLT